MLKTAVLSSLALGLRTKMVEVLELRSHCESAVVRRMEIARLQGIDRSHKI